MTLCHPMDCSMPGFPVPHHLPQLAQTHVHWVGDAIQPSHPLSPSPPPPPALNLSQQWSLFQWVHSLHQVVKVLELELQHQSFQWIFRFDFLSDWLAWSPQCPRVAGNIPCPHHSLLGASMLLLYDFELLLKFYGEPNISCKLTQMNILLKSWSFLSWHYRVTQLLLILKGCPKGNFLKLQKAVQVEKQSPSNWKPVQSSKILVLFFF